MLLLFFRLYKDEKNVKITTGKTCKGKACKSTAKMHNHLGAKQPAKGGERETKVGLHLGLDIKSLLQKSSNCLEAIPST